MKIEFQVLDQVILALLIFLSAAVFLKGVIGKIRVIRGGKREKERLDRLGERFGRAIAEVVFQTRVVGGRPIAGLLHAVVFIGFALFAAETVNHFLAAFGCPVLDILLGSAIEPFRRVMMAVAALVGLAILALAFRRFVLVKISPDPKSVSSGLVALFIYLLMATYIDMYGTRLISARIDWWVHSAIILIFPYLILKSKHFHLIMAPINIFLRHFRLGEMTVLNLDPEAISAGGEVDLGLEKVSSIPWKLRSDFIGCVECKRCTDQCPASGAGQDLRPADFILAGRAAILDGNDEASVIGSVISNKALGQCTTCMACENICPVGIEHSQLLMGAKRAQTLAIGTGGVASEFLKQVETAGNPFSAPREKRAELIEQLGIPIYKKGETEWALWMGCVWSYNPDLRKTVEGTIKILKKAGVSFGVLDRESCSGHHSRRQGEEMQFQQLAKENIARMKESSVAKIVTGCPHCLHTIGKEYHDLDSAFSPNVVHHSQMIAELISEGKIALKRNDRSDLRVTYHDPCYLGRYEGVYDSPREAVRRAGFALTELGRNRSRSYCCGGGAGGFVIESKEPRRIDTVRKEEIKQSGAGLLVTSCPECKMMLRGAVDETKDIAEVVAEALV